MIMRSIRRILVAVKDPEAMTHPLLAKAGQLAQALGARLELFHAISPWPYPGDYGIPRVQLREIERKTRAVILVQLEKIAARLRRRRIAVTVAGEWDHPVYEAIIRRARHIKADLIVAGLRTSDHSIAGLLHLTDWELLRLAPMPVLLIKTPGSYRHPVVVAAVDPAHANSKPVRLDELILSASATLTRALHGTLHALHAYVPFPLVPKPHLPLSQATLERLKADVATAARSRFERVLRTTKIRERNRHLVGRHPIDAIERTAAEIHSSIVVMGALSRSGFRGLFIGNTAEAVLDNLNCDVLVVKPAHFVSDVPQRRRVV